MPNAETFSIRPIADFVARHMTGAQCSVDPFARNCTLATHRNDIDPNTAAEWHMEAEALVDALDMLGVRADLALFDPPYSPRQISESYKGAGLAVGMKETQNATLYRRVRDALDRIVRPGGVVLSFGWHSNGMGRKRGYVLEELLLVAHGGAHNDTICIAERKLEPA